MRDRINWVAWLRDTLRYPLAFVARLSEPPDRIVQASAHNFATSHVFVEATERFKLSAADASAFVR